MLAAGALPGCVQDLQRRHLDAEWPADVQLLETPAREVRGAPAMLVVSGPVALPDDVSVTATGFEGNLSRGNTTIELEAMRVHADEGTRRPGEAAGSLSLTDGENLTVAFAPAADERRRANPDHAWNVSVEVLWRFEEDSAFDAGRVEVQRNLTPERVGGLGVGVADRAHGSVRGLVFEAIEAGELPSDLGVTVVRVSGGSAERLDRLEAQVNRSAGTARLGFPNLEVPQGTGYLLFRLDGPGGAATTGLVGGQEPVPGPGAGAALALLGLAALGLRGRGRRA